MISLSLNFIISKQKDVFVFYEYISFQYGFLEEKMSSHAVWNFSEALNVLIQNQKDWLDEFKIMAKPYSKHLALCEEMAVLWKGKNDVDYLIKRFLV